MGSLTWRMTLGLMAGVVSVCAGTLPARADVKDGVDAWDRGDYDSAIAQWQGPAAKGDADAMFNLGQAYKLGRGVPKDMAKAEDLYRRAAQKGHIRASDNYGILLFQTGRKAEAQPWLDASANRGEPRAMYILGIAAYNGDYAPQDLVRAYALMSRAAQTGLQPAVSSLAAMNEAIPLEQRQQGVALAQELDRKAVAARTSEMGSADLASAGPVVPVAGTAVVEQVPAAPVRPPVATASARPERPAPAPHAVPAVAAHDAGGAWRVQLGAFGQKEHADTLWAKVHGRPEIAGHARIDAGSGVTRLMAGGYSEAGAKSACASLKTAGLTCLVVDH